MTKFLNTSKAYAEIEAIISASKLTGKKWEYLKVKYPDYMSLTSNLSLLPDYTFEKLKAQLLAKHSGVKMSM